MYQLALSRMREFYREPEAVFWVFGFPIVLAFALGLAFRNTGPGKLQVGVVAGAGDSAVAAALAALAASPRLVPTVLDTATARLRLKAGASRRVAWRSWSFPGIQLCIATIRRGRRAVSRDSKWMMRCSAPAGAKI